MCRQEALSWPVTPANGSGLESALSVFRSPRTVDTGGRPFAGHAESHADLLVPISLRGAHLPASQPAGQATNNSHAALRLAKGRSSQSRAAYHSCSYRDELGRKNSIGDIRFLPLVRLGATIGDEAVEAACPTGSLSSSPYFHCRSQTRPEWDCGEAGNWLKL